MGCQGGLENNLSANLLFFSLSLSKKPHDVTKRNHGNWSVASESYQARGRTEYIDEPQMLHIRIRAMTGRLEWYGMGSEECRQKDDIT